MYTVFSCVFLLVVGGGLVVVFMSKGPDFCICVGFLEPTILGVKFCLDLGINMFKTMREQTSHLFYLYKIMSVYPHMFNSIISDWLGDEITNFS